jgi:UDP-glucose 4-epimerase
MARRDTVLVADGAGCIGAHCCEGSLPAIHPVMFDKLTTGHTDFVNGGPLVRGDVAVRAALGAILAQHAPVTVMHLVVASLVGNRSPIR